MFVITYLVVSGLQVVSSQFVQDITVGAPVLGLHGTSGLGKSTLCKALCDYFSGKFLGRVCHVELGETLRMAKVSHSGLDEASKMKRQHLMLQKLCSFDKGLLSRITDSGQVMEFVQASLNSLCRYFIDCARVWNDTPNSIIKLN